MSAAEILREVSSDLRSSGINFLWDTLDAYAVLLEEASCTEAMRAQMREGLCAIANIERRFGDPIGLVAHLERAILALEEP